MQDQPMNGSGHEPVLPQMSPEQADVINRQLAWCNTIVQSMFHYGVAPVGAEYYHVAQFHEKFKLLVGAAPRHLTKRKLVERVQFMMEELLEFCEKSQLVVEVAPEFSDQNYAGEYEYTGKHAVQVTAIGPDQDLGGQADALVDLAYVTYGTAVMMGLPWGPLWLDVQRANMAKVPGVTHRGHKVDVTKPVGWVGPRTDQILAAFGYQRDAYVDHNNIVREDKCHDDQPAN